MASSARQFQASGSTPRPVNPQLGPEPWFAYPTPTAEQIEEELPPYFQEENVPLGAVLDRLARKGYGDMRVLVEQTLPALNARQKPRHIIEYAKTTRQAVLKYLAVLRWKTSVDVPTSSTLPTFHHLFPAAASFPTPHSNGESSSPGTFIGKGKGKAMDEPSVMMRGKVTDAKRITHFMEHQNRQHEETIGHLRHTAKQIESLRERNPDLLTALSLLTLGTYTRLPIFLTEAFLLKPPLTNGSILTTLRRLDQHLRYRLQCIDYVPPEMVLGSVRDGRVYIGGGGVHGWKAQLTMVGFEEDSRWWLVGVEWGWRVKERGVDDPGGKDGRRVFEGEDRQQILDLANAEVLPGRPSEGKHLGSTLAVEGSTELERSGSGAVTGPLGVVVITEGEKVDAPLVRIYNFLQHLSLTYQLEVLCSKAISLSQGPWRSQLLIEMDRTKQVLRLKYWIRPRAQQVQQSAQAAAVGKRATQPSTGGAPRQPLSGGTISISLAESPSSQGDEAQDLLRDITSLGRVSSERVIKLGLAVLWEIGEAGVGAGLKAGDAMESSDLRVDPAALSLEDLLVTATRTHASHLTRIQVAPLISAPRIALFALNPPSLAESASDSSRPLALRIPLPSHYLDVGISARTGLIEIEDNGSEDRRARAKLATVAINEQKSRLLDDVGRLITAIVTENLEEQMRRLGWTPSRRIAVRSQDLAKHDLHPASTVFVPLPTSPLHYFVTKVSARGIVFELVRLARVPMEGGVGTKLVIGDRSPMDLSRLRDRRIKREQGESVILTSGLQEELPFQIEKRDLNDLFIFCNALVAQTIVEQQLKDRSIPYTLQYPRKSGAGAPVSASAVAGMVPILCVNARDLLKDGRAADVAMPKVFMQIRDWWKGGKCQVVTIVQLQHKPTLASSGASPAPATGAPSSAARAEGITFDQASSIVRFQAEDISRCVPSFLEQWERLSKVIVVAGEVSLLNKIDSFRDLKVLSFDLRTATISYAPGFNASINYSPEADSYEVSFFRDIGGKASPHEPLAGLLSHRLNELTSAKKTGRHSDMVGRQFSGLLRNTLPLLLEIESIRDAATSDFPTLVVRSVTQYRLVWDIQNIRRYALDITLLPSDQYLICDASRPEHDGTLDLSCGKISPIDSFRAAIMVACHAIRISRSGQENEELRPVMKLDGGMSLLCSVSVVAEVVRCLVSEIGSALGTEDGRKKHRVSESASFSIS